MPNYGSAQIGGVLTAVSPGDSSYLFNAESPTAPQASVAINRGFSPSAADQGITFQISFAATPTALVQIQGSNVDSDALYETIFESNNMQYDYFTDIQRFAYYRARVASQSAGGAITVLAQR